MAVRKKAVKPYHHGNLESALLEAALATIREDGVEALTLRGVGTRTGVSRAALYRHFADKDALLARVSREGFRGLHAALSEAVARAHSHSADPMDAMGLAYIAFAVANPSHYRVMFGRTIAENDGYPELLLAGETAFSVLFHAVIEGQKDNRIRAGDPMHLAQVIWSMVHGLAMLIIDGQLKGSGDPEELAQLAIVIAREGMQPSAKPASSRRGGSPLPGTRHR